MPVHGIPRVLIDQSSSVHGIPTISTDFEQGAILGGVQHLIGHGHRDIAVLVGKDIDLTARIPPATMAGGRRSRLPDCRKELPK